MAKDWLFRVCLVFVLFLCLDLVITQFPNGEGDVPKCKLPSGESGVCTPLRRCPSGLQRYRADKRKSLCWVRGYIAYICCDPNEENSEKPRVGDKSKSKCEEWYPRRSYWFGSGALIGGFQSLAKEFPHMAALGYADGDETRWACGGSLISEKFVLTAAHCIKNKELGEITKVRLGDLNLKSTTDDAQPKDLAVLRTIRHPQYKSPSQYHDVALVELSEALQFNDFIKPACLQVNREESYYELIATGWGNLEYTGPPAEHLQKVFLDPYDNELCNEFYQDTNKRRLARGIDDDSQLCAGGIDRDTCQGDSGGPLQVKNEHLIGGYTIVGITSFGKACGLSDSPGVYTRVSNYIKWIESIVWPN